MSFSWCLPSDVPQHVLESKDLEKFEHIVQNQQREAQIQWGACQKFTYILMRILYPPVSLFYHYFVRRNNFKQLKTIFSNNFDDEFWDDNKDNKSMRISTSKEDFTLAYIDFLDFSKNQEVNQGPRFPLTVLISGSGTFNNPYYFNFEGDSLLKSLVLINKNYLQNKLPMYFENLNSYLKRLTFYNFTGMILKDLNALLEWIDYGNKYIFNPLNYKVVLYLFENSYRVQEGENQQRKRRSFPIDSLLFNSFPGTFKAMINFVKYKQIKKTSEIKFGLIFTKMDEKQRQKQQEKIWRLEKKKKEESQAINFSVQHQRSHSLFSDYYLDEEEQQKFNEYERAPSSGNQLETLDDENVRRGTVRGRQRRAFSISVESTRTLELALSKPRNSCKYRWSKMRQFVLALNNLLLKQISKPPRDFYFVFSFLFSFLLSLDLVMILQVCFHLARPWDNLETIGVPFLFIYPLVPIVAPIVGVLSVR